MVPSVALFPLPFILRPAAGAGDVTADAGDFAAVLAGMEQAHPLTPVVAPLATAEAVPPAPGPVDDLVDHSAMLPSVDAWRNESTAEIAGLAPPVDMSGWVTPHSPFSQVPEAAPQTEPESDTVTADYASLPRDLLQSGDAPTPSFRPSFQLGRAIQPDPPAKPPAMVTLTPESKVPVGDWETTVHAAQNVVYSSKTALDQPDTNISVVSGHGANMGPLPQAEGPPPQQDVTLQANPEIAPVHPPPLQDDPAGLAATVEKTTWLAPPLGQDRPTGPHPQSLPQDDTPDGPSAVLPEQGKGSTAVPNPAGAGMLPQAKPELTLQEQPAPQTEKTAKVEKTISDQRFVGIDKSTLFHRPPDSAIPHSMPQPVAVPDGSRTLSPPSPAQPFPQAQPTLPDSTRAILRQIAPAAPHQDGAVEIALFPKGLGRVRLELQQGPKGAHIIVSADQAETLDLIRRHSAELVAEFRVAGMSNLQVSFTVDVGQSAPLAPRQDAASGPLANSADGGSSQQSGHQSKGSPDGQPDPRRDSPLAASLAERAEPSPHPYRSDSAQGGGLILRL
jgi:hypothetical protein